MATIAGRGEGVSNSVSHRVEQVMGMPVVVETRGAAPFDAVFAWLRLADGLFSTYRDDSEISRINRGALAASRAHPLVRDWFLGRFSSPTEPQEQGWPHILARRSTIISAPTGSGKTLAAFLACIDRLVRKALLLLFAFESRHERFAYGAPHHLERRRRKISRRVACTACNCHQRVG